MSGLRLKYLDLHGTQRFVTEDCITCGVLFAMPYELYLERNSDKQCFYCPNGHHMVYTGKTDAQRLEEAQAREVHLKDQLRAATREAEQTRVQLLRDRQRYANGVCPCCNRYFEAVRRHMASQHPEYDAGRVRGQRPQFVCSCHREFESFAGLRTHQGKSRPENWDNPNVGTYWAHLTVV